MKDSQPAFHSAMQDFKYIKESNERFSTLSSSSITSL